MFAGENQALNNVTQPCTALIAGQGLTGGLQNPVDLLRGTRFMAGRLTREPVAWAHGMECHDAGSLLV